MWWFLGVLGLSVVSWAVFSARRVLYPERRTLLPPRVLPSQTSHVVTAPDGVAFDVWLLETPSPRARILLCHGYSANRDQVLGIAEGLHDRRFEVAVIELRGHGDRPGPCTLGIKESEDACATLRWLKTRDGATSLPVGLLGLSMGASVMCQAALRDPDVRAIVVDSIYSRFFPILQRAVWERYHLPAVPWAWVTWWGLQVVFRRRLSRLDPVRATPRLALPLFAIHGGADRVVVPQLGQEFYERWCGPKERWFEPDAAHVELFTRRPQEYCERVAEFFARASRQAV